MVETGGLRLSDARRVAGAFDVLCLHPPHYASPRVRDLQLGTRDGLVMLVPITSKMMFEGADALDTALSDLASLVPRSPVVIGVNGVSQGLMRFAARHLPARVVPVQPGCPPALAELRACLTNIDDLGRRVLCWLGSHSLSSHVHSRDIAMLVESGLRVERPTDRLTMVLNRSTRRVEGVSPQGWYRLGVGLRSCVMIQSHPDESTLSIALRLRFHDAATLSRHLARLFGCRPAYVRPRLGIEWLVARWWERQSM